MHVLHILFFSRSKSTKRPKHSSYSAASGNSDVRTSVSKSKSFRAPPRSGLAPDYQRYRKNKTADLSKLTLEDSADHPEHVEEVEPSAAIHRSHSMRRPLMKPSAAAANSHQEDSSTVQTNVDEQDQDSDSNANKTKKSKTTKMFQNFSSLFKNIR